MKELITLLARQLREDAHQRTPYSLISSNGKVTRDPKEVSELFRVFSAKLYSLPDTIPSDSFERDRLIVRFLSSCCLPSLPTEAVSSLNAPLTGEKIEEVLKLLPSGKSPVPDGLTYLYYQTFRSQLLPHMVTMYNPILHNIITSYISLIPKPDKDYLECSNYRPITLLNTDLKIFTKILSNRLSLWLPQMVHKDQVGFVPCNCIHINFRLFAEIRRFLNKWNTLPLSLFGRISSVKMTILPKLLYLFETLPVLVPMR